LHLPQPGEVYRSTRRFDDSLAEFAAALQLNPNLSSQRSYGLVLTNCGRWQ